MDIGEMIPADDSVRLLNSMLERMDYRKLYAVYSRMGRIERSPKSLFKIVVYGRMNGLYSSRKIEQACLRDINFMYLLGRERAPDHATIARFCSQRLTGVVQELFAQLVRLLADAGELSLLPVFIDGTKLEANANRYSFVRCGMGQWRQREKPGSLGFSQAFTGSLKFFGFSEQKLRFYSLGGGEIPIKPKKLLRPGSGIPKKRKNCSFLAVFLFSS